MTVVLGPERIVKFSRQTGQFIRNLISSPIWKEISSTSDELRKLPQRLVEETGLEKDITSIKEEITGINLEINQAQIETLNQEPMMLETEKVHEEDILIETVTPPESNPVDLPQSFYNPFRSTIHVSNTESNSIK